MEHGAPSGFAGFEHPFTGSQVPISWHSSSALQATGVCPAHAPLLQLNAWKHTFVDDGVHDVPSAAAAYEHAPELGSHVPVA
jgi:hypothetical protein